MQNHGQVFSLLTTGFYDTVKHYTHIHFLYLADYCKISQKCI